MRIKKYVIVFFVLIAIFLGSMVFTAALPRLDMDKNIVTSINVMNTEKDYPTNFYKYKFSQLDNHTDTRMLNVAYHLTRANALDTAVACRYYWDDILSPRDGLKARAALNILQPNTNYSRYWHGYVVFLRPLLAFFEIREIRMINAYIFYLFLFICMVTIYKKVNWQLAFSFLFVMVMLNIGIIHVSMQFITVTLISMIACTVVLHICDKYENSVPLFFFIVGAVTMFFDFYTFPVLTYGLPIVCVVARYYLSDDSFNGKKAIKIVMLCLLTWALGYLLTWIAKNLIAFAVIGMSEILAAKGSVSFRLSADYAGFKGIALSVQGIKRSFGQIYFLPLISFGGIWTILIIAFRNRHYKFSMIPALLIVSIIPIVWLMAAANPTYIHYWFQGRMLGVSFLCWIYIVLCFVDYDQIISLAKKILAKRSKKAQ